MSDPEAQIGVAYAAYQRRAFSEARSALAGVAHPKALQLRGLIEKADGQFGEAEIWFQRAADADPSNHEVLNSLGLLARQQGAMHKAAAFFEQALSLNPAFHSARLSLARSWTSLERFDDALRDIDVYIRARPDDPKGWVAKAHAAIGVGDLEGAEAAAQRARALAPTDRFARFAVASVHLNRGALDEAEAMFKELVSNGHVDAETYQMLARIMQERGDVTVAEQYALSALREGETPGVLAFLVDLYWRSDQNSKFDQLISDAMEKPSLVWSAIGQLRKAGRFGDAYAAFEELPDELALAPHGQSMRLALLLDLGRTDDAIKAAGDLERENLGEQNAFHLMRAFLAAGEIERALTYIRRARNREPLSQFWLAYEATALRLLDDPRHRQLMDCERLVMTYELPVPEGYNSLAEFNAALLKALDHQQTFARHPLDQSLRSGVQSPRDLTKVNDPVLCAYYAALDGPIRDYLNWLGNDPDHPTSARNMGRYKFAGGWSVRLGAGGHHVNHIHPRGWISSAYYVAVPNEVQDPDEKSGWIKFGEPPVVTKPVLAPQMWVQPKPGRLVLFPSFFWHGSQPIHDGSVRVTAPFDLVPA